MNSATIVQKLWNYCNVLRDDGMSYGDYVGVKGNGGEWHLLKEKTSNYVVIPAKAGIQGLKNIGR